MSEWQEVQIGEQIDLTSGYAFKSINFLNEHNENSLPVIKIKNVANGDVNLDNVVYHSINNDLEKFRISKGDVLIAMTGNHPQAQTQVVGDVSKYKLNSDSLLNQRVGKFVMKGNTCLDFIYYLFKSEDVRSYLANQSSGSANQANISKGDILGLILTVPEPKEQEDIASVLSSLDDKIDLLHRQNQTLEKMAETLFRQWFVEEAKEEWEVKPLGELVTVKRGGSPRPIQDYLADTGLKWLKISDVTSLNSPYIFEIKEHIRPEGLNKTTLLKAGALVLSNSATPGIPKILRVDSCIHDGWLHFPQSKLSNEFLYLLFLRIREELLSHGNGSIFTNLKTDIIKEFPIAVPDSLTLEKFDKDISFFFKRLLQNATQIRTLTSLRDTLLPKLMSGEVRVDFQEVQP